MMKMRWKKWLAGAMGLLLLAVLVPLGAAAQPEQVHISAAQELSGILSQTQPEATQGKEYVLDADITLDTNTLRQGLNPEDIRDNTFVGQESLLTLEGDEGVYTDFTGVGQMGAIAAAEGNRVVFLRDGACPYKADVTFQATA